MSAGSSPSWGSRTSTRRSSPWAAAEGRLSPAEIADEERRQSLVTRLLEAMAEGGEAWSLARSGPLPAGEGLSRDEIRALIRDTIVQTASRGDAVLVAHGRRSSCLGNRMRFACS